MPRAPTRERKEKPGCAVPPIFSAAATTIGATVAPTVKPALTWRGLGLGLGLELGLGFGLGSGVRLWSGLGLG